MLRCVRRTAAEVLLLVMMMMVTSIEDVRERQMRSQLTVATEADAHIFAVGLFLASALSVQ